MNNRFVTNGFGTKQLAKVFDNQLGTVRVVADVNVSERGQLQTHTGRKTGEASVTVLVEYGLSVRGVNRIRVTLMGSLAEQAIADKLKTGDQIRFDGQEHIGRRGHYCPATWYEKVTGQVTKSSIVSA